jgi:hypothetical protein
MSTVTKVEALIYKHKMSDHKASNVIIRLYHKGEKKFIPTEHWVVAKQYDKQTGRITDPFVNLLLDAILLDYRRKMSSKGTDLQSFSAERLKLWLMDKNEDVDFLAFCRSYVKKLQENKQGKHAAGLNTVTNHLVDYFNGGKISSNDITTEFLEAFKVHLRTPHTILRKDRKGFIKSQKTKGCGDAGVHNYLRDLQILFKAACAEYNNVKLKIIKIAHDPFEELEVVPAPVTAKRNVDAAMFIAIRDSEPPKNSRAELARDIFLISFYLCGINSVDILKLRERNISKGRLNYNRSKTEDRREDDAFISVKIPYQVYPLLVKYIPVLCIRYSTIGTFNAALSKGWRVLSKMLNIEITPAFARGGFATIARNKCKMPKEDISEALNHLVKAHKTIDIYLEKDWSMVDDVQRAVIEYIDSCDHRRKVSEILPKATSTPFFQSIICNSLTE